MFRYLRMISEQHLYHRRRNHQNFRWHQKYLYKPPIIKESMNLKSENHTNKTMYAPSTTKEFEVTFWRNSATSTSTSVFTSVSFLPPSSSVEVLTASDLHSTEEHIHLTSLYTSERCTTTTEQQMFCAVLFNLQRDTKGRQKIARRKKGQCIWCSEWVCVCSVCVCVCVCVLLGLCLSLCVVVSIFMFRCLGLYFMCLSNSHFVCVSFCLFLALVIMWDFL